MAAAMEEQRRYLTKLDSEIGDGDHGTNMHRGFQAALERLDGADPGSPADALKAVSMALISKVGGAAGPLYGTAFLRASTALQGKDEVSRSEEHTSELQSRQYLVCRLLLEKKKPSLPLTDL